MLEHTAERFENFSDGQGKNCIPQTFEKKAPMPMPEQKQCEEIAKGEFVLTKVMKKMS